MTRRIYVSTTSRCLDRARVVMNIVRADLGLRLIYDQDEMAK